jgi:hypothetical protein
VESGASSPGVRLRPARERRVPAHGKEAVDVRSLRQRFSDCLLQAGENIAFDRQEMCRGLQRSDVRTRNPRDVENLAQVLWLLDVVSRAAIRLGMIVMPAQPREF